jgi:DNA invertase Pin-like site-specific DNA recombinase
MSKAKPAAYSYIRFSHPDQAKGDSLRRQAEKRDAWLKKSGAVLDTSLTLHDRGVSAFTGEHRTNPDRHALAAFLELVKQGRIAKGSYLIVESLDRLSREHIRPALTLLLNLIDAGIRVVQLIPVEAIYDEDIEPMTLMMAIMELSRGHSESQAKSERVGPAWQEKKRRAAENGEPLTSRAPAWLRLVDGRWQVIEGAAQAVRQIFRWAIDGYGLGVITKKLNAEKVPTISNWARGRPYWPRSYVAKILSNRAVIGEYQPFTGRGRKRRPDGDPIPGYYPAIVSEQDWHAARGSLANRRSHAGRIGKAGINLFAGLLHDARDGGTFVRVNKGQKASGVSLAPYRAVQGVGKYFAFPFGIFESAVLSCLHEINPRDILPKKDRSGEQVLALSGQYEEVLGEIEKVKARLQAKYSDAVADVLDRHEERKRALAEQLAEAKQEASSPAMEAWGQAKSLIETLDKAPDPDEARTRLRAAIRRIVDSIWMLVVPRGAARLAAVQIWFADGKHHRDYFILHRKANGGAVESRPAQWWARSLADVVKPGALDLRKRADAARLEKLLAGVEIGDLEA